MTDRPLTPEREQERVVAAVNELGAALADLGEGYNVALEALDAARAEADTLRRALKTIDRANKGSNERLREIARDALAATGRDNAAP